MEIILLLITISISIAIAFLTIFIWVLRTGQYDDTYTPSVRMLFDNEKTTSHSTTKSKEQKKS